MHYLSRQNWGFRFLLNFADTIIAHPHKLLVGPKRSVPLINEWLLRSRCCQPYSLLLVRLFDLYFLCTEALKLCVPYHCIKHWWVESVCIVSSCRFSARYFESIHSQGVFGRRVAIEWFHSKYPGKSSSIPESTISNISFIFSIESTQP